jgi:hypothetical protein
LEALDELVKPLLAEEDQDLWSLVGQCPRYSESGGFRAEIDGGAHAVCDAAEI